MTLEDLVAPLDLCKKIPDGKFEDTALVWNTGYIKGYCYPTKRGEGFIYLAPAPTVQEILADLAKDGLSPKIHGFMHGENLLWNIASEKYGESAAEIALKLWFELTAEKSEKSDKAERD